MPAAVRSQTDVLERINIYLPEDGVYCAAQEALSRFRRQELGPEDGHELFEVDLSVT